jgi:SAM-dependent methyltransferase
MRWLYSWLSRPEVYLRLQSALGADRLRRLCIDEFLRPQPGERILDLGCGPGQVLAWLPAGDYVGFDTEQRYIDYALATYGTRGAFHCAIFDESAARPLGRFDAVLLFGLIHHLADAEVQALLKTVTSVLKPSGRVVTLDPCFTPDQSAIARRVAAADRGRHVRAAPAYDALVAPYFRGISARIVHNICRIPSTERIMLLTEPMRDD